MRKLKLQVQITIDGYIAGPNGEMDWIEWNWDDEIKQYVNNITQPVESIILGRKLAEGFIPHWANVAANPDDPEFLSGKKYTDTHKVVFTKTLNKSKWDNTVLATGKIVDEVHKLKNQGSGDIIAYGGSTFASSLIKHGLIDEFHLFINPVAIGNGMAIFKERESKQDFVLETSHAFPCGIVLVKYRKAT